MQNTGSVRTETAEPTWKQSGLRVLLGVSLALASTFAVLCLLAAVQFWGDFGDRPFAPIATVFALLSLFFGAKIATRRTRARGIVLGAAVGLLYYLVIYIVASVVFAEFQFSVQTASFMLIGVLTGCVGGVAGQNCPEKKSKKHKKKK